MHFALKTEPKQISLAIENIPKPQNIKIYILDEKRDMTLYKEITATSKDVLLTLEAPLFTSYYISL